MAQLSASSDGRFVSQANQVLAGQKGTLSKNTEIINAIIASTSNDLKELKRGLLTEKHKDSTLDVTWRRAETFYDQQKKTNATYTQSGVPREYHVALIVYALVYWYKNFNDATRELTSVEAVKGYPYKNFFKLLLLAIVNVKGNPYELPIDLKVYRGISGHIQCVEGSQVAFQHITSTTRDRATALGYAGQGERTLFVIPGIIPSGCDSGRQLGTSGCPNIICLDHIAPYNQECLIWPCEMFIVEKIERQPDGLHVIYLKA